MDTNYHALNSKLAVVLMPHHTTTSEMWAAPHGAWCHDQDDLPVAQHCAMGSCSGCWGMCLLKKHLPLQANPKFGCVPYLMSSSGFPQWTPRAFLPEAADDDSHTAWHEQSSYRALQLEQEHWAIHWKPPHFTLFPMHFCISNRGYVTELENRETDFASI